MSWAPITEAPPGSADVFATGRVRAFCGLRGELVRGCSVGKRLPALPPGLSVGLWCVATPAWNGGMPGKLPTGKGDEVTTGTGGAVTVILAEAAGSFGRCAALPMTDRVTDVTLDAVAGTVSCA